MTDKVMWEGDGTTFTIKSDNVAVIETPFATLAEAPITLVGRDPMTGLPAYCPAPATTTNVPVPPPLVPPGTCVQVRCGAAWYLRGTLEDTYNKVSTLLQWGLQKLGAVAAEILLDTVIAFLLATEAAAWLVILVQAIKPLAEGLAGAALSSFVAGLDSGQLTNLFRGIWCQLDCAGGTLAMTPQDILDWGGWIEANPSYWANDVQRDLLALITHFVPFEIWQTQALQGGLHPLTDCDGFSCA